MTLTLSAFGQRSIISGRVITEEGPLEVAAVIIKNEKYSAGTTSDEKGNFLFEQVPEGDYELKISRLGYTGHYSTITVTSEGLEGLEVFLAPDRLNLNEVVITGSRYEQDRKESPVIVNVLRPKLLRATQSFSISEGLSYQPGVRVEANCQNCGFTQVRLNGLNGSYSQILINSRPVYSALNSVYGLEQIPTSIIDRVEIVRSGGSALYGSNAIAGTINIITKEPVENNWQISSNFGFIDRNTTDKTINVNGSLISDDLNSGVTLFGMHRTKDAYDANGDGFTELTRFENNTFGAKAFVKPTKYSKITADFSGIREYRRGGDRLETAPHLTDITEELDHNIVIGGITYDQFSKSQNSKYSFYVSGSSTQRDSYYGGLGGGRSEADSALALNAYGNTDDLALVAGFQFSHSLNSDHTIIAGIENQYNNVDDNIPGYERVIDQSVNTIGLFAQYEWKPTPKLKTLLGARYDQARVEGVYTLGDIQRTSDFNSGVFSPRVTLLYDLTGEIQLRGGYARGFRAPQAFNEDLHISSVGGEPQFVILSDDLERETSDAFTLSFNYLTQLGSAQFNLLLEGFYTNLTNPFTIVSTGASLPNGSILEEQRNGAGAYVTGLNFQSSFSPSAKWLIDMGGTIQKSIWRESQVLFEPEGNISGETAVSVDEFVRTPSSYGYITANWSPLQRFSIDATGIFTGRMIVPRVVSESGFIDLVESNNFFDFNLKFSYNFSMQKHCSLQINTGIQNLFNAFQDDFDTGPQRDSDYVYGPIRPRMYFVGLVIGDFL
jgi:outer membrane receptor for ferrienterochelin and colicins